MCEKNRELLSENFVVYGIPDAAKGRCVAWKTWDLICQPKQNGALGFRKFKELNQTIIAKLCWIQGFKAKPISNLSAKESFIVANLINHEAQCCDEVLH